MFDGSNVSQFTTPEFANPLDQASQSYHEGNDPYCNEGEIYTESSFNYNHPLREIQKEVKRRWGILNSTTFGIGIKEVIKSNNYLFDIIDANNFEDEEYNASALSEKYSIFGPLSVNLSEAEFQDFEEKSRKINYQSILEMNSNCLEKARKLKAKRIGNGNTSD